MILTNLRNRPLSNGNVDSMRLSILSLFHDLVTDSKDFPTIRFKGFFVSRQMDTPFRSWTENSKPSRFMFAPAGLMVPPVGSSSSLPNILTPVLPEKTELGVLKADRRNFVCSQVFEGIPFTRVISPVFTLACAELPNLWRLTDYSEEGRVIMSVLCQFTRKTARHAMAPVPQKRKDPEEEDSSSSDQSPPKKRLRL